MSFDERDHRLATLRAVGICFGRLGIEDSILIETSSWLQASWGGEEGGGVKARLHIKIVSVTTYYPDRSPFHGRVCRATSANSGIARKREGAGGGAGGRLAGPCQ